MAQQPQGELPSLRELGAAEFDLAAQVWESLGELIYQMRKRRGLSLRQVQEQTGIDLGTIRKLELGGGCGSKTGAPLLRWLSDMAAADEPD
jgi:hypothetical protein